MQTRTHQCFPVGTLFRFLQVSWAFTALTGLVGFCPACAMGAMAGRKPLEGPQ